MFVLETQLPCGKWHTIGQHETYAVIKDKETAVLAIRESIFGTVDNPTDPDEPPPPVRVRNTEIYATPQEQDEAEAGEVGWDEWPDDDFEDRFEHDHSMDY